MSLPDWIEAPLARQHDRKTFDCGEPALNEYLARYTRQNHESGGAKTFIASPVDEPSRSSATTRWRRRRSLRARGAP